MKQLRVIVAAVASLLTFHATTANAADKKADSVYYGAHQLPVRSLDPATCADTPSTVLQTMVFEGLYQYHYLKRPIEVIPQLAAAMPQISANGLVWTIKIKKGVKYAPNACFGRDKAGRLRTRTVRASDFVFAFKRIADQHLPNSHARSFIQNTIKGLDFHHARSGQFKAADLSRYDWPASGLLAVDELTLQIRLTKPFPRLTHILAKHNYAPIPPEAVKHCWLKTGGIELNRPDLLVGTGPYILKEFNNKGPIVLVRNPEFRAEFYPSEGSAADKAAGLLNDAGKRLPLVDRVQWDYVKDDSLAFKALLAGRIDVTGIPPDVFNQVAQVVGTDVKLTKAYADRGMVLARSQANSLYGIGFNMANPVVGKSKSLRQAMCLAVDVENYVKTTYNGRAKSAVNCVPSCLPGHASAGPGSYAKLDRALARKKLADARKELAAAGVIKPGAAIPPIELDFVASDAETVKRTKFLAGQFAAIGLTVTPVRSDLSALRQKVTDSRARMFMMGWHGDYGDVEDFLRLYYSPNSRPGESVKYAATHTCYSNPEFDTLFKQLQAMPHGRRRQDACTKAIRMISEDCPILPLAEPTAIVLHHKWVRNYKLHPEGCGMMKYRRIDTANRPQRKPIKKP